MNPDTTIYILKSDGYYIFGARNCASKLHVKSLDELQHLINKRHAEDDTPNPFYYASQDYIDCIPEAIPNDNIYSVMNHLISVVRNDFAEANEVKDGEYLMAIAYRGRIIPETCYYKYC